MVRQFRTGRFGQPLSSGQQPQTEQITPEQIRDEPEVPSGKFGRGLKATEALRERAFNLRSIRQQAIEEAQRLEQEFFSQRITNQEAEEAYGQVDPLVRQFIKTSPSVRKARSEQILQDIKNRIAIEEQNANNLRQKGGDLNELRALEAESIAHKLKDLVDEAESGAYSYEELVNVAESVGRARKARAEARQFKSKTTSQTSFELKTVTRPLTVNELVARGVPRDVAIKIKSEQPISLEEFYKLPKTFREQSGLTRANFEGTSQLPVTQRRTMFGTELTEDAEKRLQNIEKFIGGAFSGRTYAGGVARSKGFKEGTPEYEKEIQKQITGINLQSAVLASIAGVPKLPKVIKVPLRSTKIPSFVEIQQPIVTRGKQVTLSKFTIKTELKAPSIILDSRKAGGLLGIDKTLTKIPAKIQLTKTILPVVNEGKVLTLTSKTGKLANVDTLEGFSRRVNTQSISTLPKMEKFLLQRLAETKTKVPVSFKNTPTLLGKKDQVTLGILEKTRFGKVRTPVNLKLLEEQAIGFKVRGKSTTRFQIASKFRTASETDSFELLKGKIVFKDITKPLAKATGKTPQMKGLIKVMKEPIVLDDFKDVNLLRPSRNARRTPLSLTFQRQELKQIAKPLPKLPKLTQSKALKSITSPKLSGVSGVLLGSNLRGNLGNIDRTLRDFSRGFVNRFEDSSKSNASAQTKEKQITLLSNLPKQEYKQITREISKNIQKELTKQSPKEVLRLTQKQIPKLTLKQIQKTTPKLIIPRGFFGRSPRPRMKASPLFRLPKFRPITRPRRSSTFGRNGLALAEGFTARILRLPPLRIREKDIGKALERQANISRIRLRPLVIPNSTKSRSLDLKIPNSIILGLKRKRRRRSR